MKKPRIEKPTFQEEIREVLQQEFVNTYEAEPGKWDTVFINRATDLIVAKYGKDLPKNESNEYIRD
jgi:hypothetical protein